MLFVTPDQFFELRVSCTRGSMYQGLQTGFVGKGSDHLQLVKSWPSRAPGKGSAAGAKIFLAPPYYSQRSVFASSPSAFSSSVCYVCRQHPWPID